MNIWQDPAQIGMEMHSADLGHHRYDRHSHDEYSLIVVTGGTKILRAGPEEHIVAPGQIIIIPPGVSHDCEAQGSINWSHCCWYLSPSLVAELLDQPSFATAPPRIQFVQNAVSLASKLVIAHHAPPSPETYVNQLSLIRDAFSNATNCVHASDSTRNQPQRIKQYLDVMSDGIEQALDLDHLAEVGNVTRFQVIRDFKKVFHMTPGRLLKDLKLRKSKELIRRGGSLVDISTELGFSDQSHFTRSFRAIYGFTPGQFLNAVPKPK